MTTTLRKIRLSKILSALALAIILWLLFLAGRIYTYSFESDPGPADAAIVLGAAVWTDRPSPVFRQRIDHAINLYHQGIISAIIFTGGLSDGDQLSEAEAGRQLALAAGVPAEDIFIETTSINTYYNLANAIPILEQQSIERLLIVSDPLHMHRAVQLADLLGLDAHPSPTPTTRYTTWRSKSGFLLRELYFAILFQFGHYR